MTQSLEGVQSVAKARKLITDFKNISFYGNIITQFNKPKPVAILAWRKTQCG
jgi:hypothetical protein